MNFILLNQAGIAVPAKSTDGVIVHDTSTGLMWSADRIAPEELLEVPAHGAAAECRLGGFSDWRVPTVSERLSISDFGRFSPALNTDFFRPCEGWEWTSTECAWSRSDVWFVGSDGGNPSDGHRGASAWLRVVRSVSSAPASSQ